MESLIIHGAIKSEKLPAPSITYDGKDTVKKNIGILALIFSIIILAGCGLKKEVRISGKTMGTIYTIKVVTWFYEDTEDLKENIESRLEAINRSMSTYRKDSEISRFNAFRNTKDNFHISEDFHHVMTIAEKLHTLTGRAWDGTVKPLVNLWGFGASDRKNKIPEEREVKAMLADIGFDSIQISQNLYLKKKKATVSLNLASIAKGYAVDEVAAIIKEKGANNFLVEIGGEVYASGLRKDGEPWKVGINTPRKDAAVDQVYKAVALQNQALATSGDYRNYFEIDGKRYSHVIDPKTGYPVNNGVVSVSIIADTCTFADGLATAVMVMGHEKGLSLVNGMPKVECLIVVLEQNGKLTDHYSGLFKDTLLDY